MSAISTSKFYFFDIGVAHTLQNIEHISQGTSLYGDAVEHLVFSELQAYISYNEISQALTYWRSTSNIEVDFMIGEQIAIEVKAAGRISDSDCRGLRALSEEVSLKTKIIVSSEEAVRTTEDGIKIMPIHTFLTQLWDGGIV